MGMLFLECTGVEHPRVLRSISISANKSSLFMSLVFYLEPRFSKVDFTDWSKIAHIMHTYFRKMR